MSIIPNDSPENSRLLSAKELMSIAEAESGSVLVSINEVCPEIISAYKKMDMIPYTGDEIYVRVEVAQMLNSAVKILQEKTNSSLKFYVCYGYRHPDVQKMYFDKRYSDHKNVNMHLSEAELIEITHQQVAYPEVAGHPTGGAVDITLVYPDGTEVDMGTKIADYSVPDKCFTFCKDITKEQYQNRMLLRDCLMNVGFAPFNGEWWHFSFGDREWACFYGMSVTKYMPLLYKKVAHK
jgi:zinc D-Ala-D-Ala dipeptidase